MVRGTRGPPGCGTAGAAAYSQQRGRQLPWGCLVSVGYTAGVGVYSWCKVYSWQRIVCIASVRVYSQHRGTQLAIPPLLYSYAPTIHSPSQLYAPSITGPLSLRPQQLWRSAIYFVVWSMTVGAMAQSPTGFESVVIYSWCSVTALPQSQASPGGALWSLTQLVPRAMRLPPTPRASSYGSPA